MSTLSAKEYKCFEDIKRVRPDGSEYWAARELAPVLDYAKWENFYKVIKRAMIACENSGRSTLECFPEVRKTSPMPNGGVKDILDYELSRYACYLIVQNGDPRKEVIALGQTYFAIQTYRQEVADRFNQLDEDSRRLVVRGDIKQWNQLLAETAQNAGVITAEEFAIFQNAGYTGTPSSILQRVAAKSAEDFPVILISLVVIVLAITAAVLIWRCHKRRQEDTVYHEDFSEEEDEHEE